MKFSLFVKTSLNVWKGLWKCLRWETGNTSRCKDRQNSSVFAFVE